VTTLHPSPSVVLTGTLHQATPAPLKCSRPCPPPCLNPPPPQTPTPNYLPVTPSGLLPSPPLPTSPSPQPLPLLHPCPHLNTKSSRWASLGTVMTVCQCWPLGPGGTISTGAMALWCVQRLKPGRVYGWWAGEGVEGQQQAHQCQTRLCLLLAARSDALHRRP
jgi:hypothetical protein